LILHKGSSRFVRSIELMKTKGKGLVLFMRQHDKMANLEQSLDNLSNPTADSVATEQRDLGIGAQIMKDLGIHKINLLSASNKRKVGLEGYGLEIVENTYFE